MSRWWRELDRILRGEATRPSSLSRGRIEVRVGEVAAVAIVLAMIYGACMGFYGLWKDDGPFYRQFLSAILKVPALFVLTLVVTLPSLYVSNALMGSRLTMDAVVRLLAAAMAVTVAVLASLGPIVAFFSASTKSYSFMLLLNVAVFAASAAAGLAFLLRTLERLSRIPPKPATETTTLAVEEPLEVVPELGSLERDDEGPTSRRVALIFRLWIVLFGLVGAQMAWVLRPFLGYPGRPFEWFRARESNFFEAVWHAFLSFFS